MVRSFKILACYLISCIILQEVWGDASNRNQNEDSGESSNDGLDEDELEFLLRTRNHVTSHLERVKRDLTYDSSFFKETELEIRERITGAKTVNLERLPKFGGKDAPKPYFNLIQLLTHTRSYRDGPVNGAYGQTTADTISVAVDPVLHKFSKGKWAIFAGSRERRCMPQAVYGNGHKVVFDCFAEGTYYAFFRVEGTFKDETDVVDGTRYRPPEEVSYYFNHENFDDFFLDPLMFYTDFENELLNGEQSVKKPWYYSDPIKLVSDAYCYRWSYRISKENEVGFVHFEPSPVALGGIYKEFTLKVWISDPSEVTQEELNSPTELHTSHYSKIVTNKFYLAGLVPCIRHAHPSIELVADPVYMKDGDIRGESGHHDSARLHGPHWRFQLKVYYDKVVSTLSNIAFTITSRQHSALYDCFIAEIRVYMPTRSFTLIRNSKVPKTTINLKYSWLSPVKRRFIKENAVNYFGHEAVYVGPPHIMEKNFRVTVLSNPCINQELTVTWKGKFAMTSDFFVREDLEKLILPSLQDTGIGLRGELLQLSPKEMESQLTRSNNYTYTKDPELRIRVFDFAYTPAGLIILTDDSSLYFQSPDLSLKGIGYNTMTRKYKLESLVARRWCAKTSTPKCHNMWIPGFSRSQGNFVIIYNIPTEGASVIKHQELSAGCEKVLDTTPNGKRSLNTVSISEKEIHKDEADDARMDKSVEAKLRTKAAVLKAMKRQAAKPKPPRKLTQSDLAQDRTFWIVGSDVLSKDDPHYASGSTDAKNVHTAATGIEHYNSHVVFQIDCNFERTRSAFEKNGLLFDLDETVYSAEEEISRDSPNTRLFTLHSIQFTGVEKRYLLAVGFQSVEFPKTINYMNSTLVIVITFLPNDLPVVFNATLVEEDISLTKVDVAFSGAVIRRTQTSHTMQHNVYSLTESDFIDDKRREVKPAPLSKLTTIVNSINTALTLFVLQMNDVVFFASLDGSFAKPLLCYEDYPTPDHSVTPRPYLPDKKFDILVTEEGVLSALSRKEFSGEKDAIPSGVFIGSVLVNEPLRSIHPFHVSNNVFQVITEEGEIVYGHLDYNKETQEIDSPPKTTILNIPFWSMLKGSFARSAGDTNIPLDRHVPDEGSRNLKNLADPICPFASFEVYYVAFPYVEAQYKTRITVEVAFYGDAIPLEADVIVEFAEVQGVSVVVSSFLEVEYDQTIIRKTLEIETFLPQPQLEDMYNKHFSIQSDQETATTEQVHVFTLTMRPSLLNLHCSKKDYFRTIQVNVGCVPISHMRLLAEALPLRKIEVYPYRSGLTKHEYEANWFHDGSNSEETGVSHLIIPRDKLHFSQRKISGCADRKATFCRFKIPAGKQIENHIYGLSFRDTLVPKFEQFLTQHVRRITGNIVIYDLLDSYKDASFRIETNTTQHSAKCIVDDGNWYGKMAERSKHMSLKADIYRYFNNCFTRRPSYHSHDLMRKLPLLSIQEMNNRTFYLFNRTNMNALRLQKRRNFIYLMRAVVVNTEYNRFTFCANLDTFFALQVANMATQRAPLNWEWYVIIFFLVLLSVICCYVYFAKYKHWRTRIVTNRILMENMEVEDDLQAQLERNELERVDPYRKVAEKAAQFQRFHELATQLDAEMSAERMKTNEEPYPQPVTLDTLHKRISAMPKV